MRHRSARAVARALPALIALAFPTSLYAAPSNLPGAVTPGRDRPQPTVPTTPPDVDFRLESTQRSPVTRAADTVHFHLVDIRIEGAQVFHPDSFRPLYQDLLGKDVTLSNILDVADKIEAQYRAAGYLLVRAYVPPQRVKDGIFTIKVVEGFVSNVSVEGVSPDTADIAKSYFGDVVGQTPLQLASIERALLLSNDIPGVTAVGTLRAAPATPGASELIINADAPPIQGGVSTNDRGSRFSGRWTLNGDAALNDLLGGDQLALGVTTSPDAKEQISSQLTYRKAIGPDGLIGSVYGVYTHGQPGDTLAVAGVLTDSWAAGVHASYPLVRSRALTVLLQGGFAAQAATIRAAGAPISHDEWRVVDVGATALESGFLDASWSGGIDIAQGIDAFGATQDGSPELSRPGAKNDFTKFTANFEVQRQIAGPVTIDASGSGQLSTAHLINGEEVSYGGTQVVRGYDPGSITGDDGIGGAVELRYDAHFPDQFLDTIEPYLLLAGARTWYIDAATHGLSNEGIGAVGVGVRAWLPHNITWDVEVTRMLNATPGSDNGRAATKVLIDAAINF